VTADGPRADKKGEKEILFYKELIGPVK